MNGYWPEDDRPPPMTEKTRSSFWTAWMFEDFLPLACIGIALFVVLLGLWNLDLLLAAVFDAFLLIGCVWLAILHALRRDKP